MVPARQRKQVLHATVAVGAGKATCKKGCAGPKDRRPSARPKREYEARFSASTADDIGVPDTGGLAAHAGGSEHAARDVKQLRKALRLKSCGAFLAQPLSATSIPSCYVPDGTGDR